jgi:hypothetical protein
MGRASARAHAHTITHPSPGWSDLGQPPRVSDLARVAELLRAKGPCWLENARPRASKSTLESLKLEMRCIHVKFGSKPEIRIPKSETNSNLEWPKSKTTGVSRLPRLDFEIRVVLVSLMIR